MAATQRDQKVTVVISSPTPQRVQPVGRRIGVPTTIPAPIHHRRLKKGERVANSPAQRIQQVRQRRQAMEDTPVPRVSRDLLKMVPDQWWMSFNALDEHLAWYIIRRQVQTQLLKFEFLVCPVAFGMAAPRMTDLLTVFTRPLVRLERREHNRIVRQRFLRHLHKRFTGRVGQAGPDSLDANNEHDDPSPRLMVLGPADKIGALSAMGRRKTRNVSTTPLQAMYRAMLCESYMGLTKSIDMTFYGLQWSSVPVFGPREYQLRSRLIAAMRKARDPLNARPPSQLFIVHDVVWAQRAKIRLCIGEEVYERWVGRVNLGYRLAMYNRFSSAGMVTFPSDYADPVLYFDKMLSPTHTMWLTPPPGIDAEEDGARKAKPRMSKDQDSESSKDTSIPRQFGVHTRRPKKLKRFKAKTSPNPSTLTLYGSLLQVPPMNARSIKRSRSRSEEKRLGKTLRPLTLRSRSASALLTRDATSSKESSDANSAGSSEDASARSFVPGRRPAKARVFKSKLLTPSRASTSTAPESFGNPPPSDSDSDMRPPAKRFGNTLKPRSRSASAMLMRVLSGGRSPQSHSPDRSHSMDPTYAKLLFEPSHVSSAFDSIIEGTDFFSSAEDMRGPVRNLPPF